MRQEYMPAIDGLERELEEVERKAGELRGAINTLCRLAGIEARYAEGSINAKTAPTLTQLRPDTFYGKKMQTAAREFLEMRKTADLGPATPKNVYEALRDGGYQFETQDEVTALISLRATLRKNSQTFHKLPNGQYGLRAWYPNARPAKDDDDERPAARAAKAAKRSTAKTAKVPKAAKPAKAPKDATEFPPVANFVISVMGDGGQWSLDRLMEEAQTNPNVPDAMRSVNKKGLHGALLGLKSRRLVTLASKGIWRLMSETETAADDESAAA
jgi:hypothetical protein